MKNSLAKIVGGVILSSSLLFAPMKVSADDFYLQGGIALKAEGGFSPVCSKSRRISSGLLVDFGVEARGSVGYKTDIVDLELGARGGLSLNGDITGGYEGAFNIITKSPLLSPSLDLFTRATFFDRLFFEYSAGLTNQYSVLFGNREYEIADSLYPSPSSVQEHRDIRGEFSLGNTVDHKLKLGLHLSPPESYSFIEAYLGLTFTQPVNMTPSWNESEIFTRPAFSLGAVVGLEN